MATVKKSDIQDRLTELGIPFEADAKVADLKALLPAGDPLIADDVQDTSTAQGVDPDRQARFDAFLVEARKVNPARFDEQKKSGEFDKIPDSFQ